MNFILGVIIIILVYLTLKYFNETKKIKEKYKDIIDIQAEKDKIETEKENISIWIKETKHKELENIIKIKTDLEKDLNKIKHEINIEKNKSLELIDIRENLKKEINILEEEKELQEFSIYKPKFYYENSENYRLKLVELNEKIKEMVKNKKAAICTTEWAVHGSKKEGKKMTAETLKLMIRAFNGEVDSAIAKVKYNNIKTMETRIYRAFETINKLNEVKTCFITKEYLELKLKELYLNFEMAEKIQEEKEEIRRAREEDRENEKARKEYEKAQAEALKEEERSRKALEKAEEKLKNAHGVELDKLNTQIEKLKLALEEAQKNKERAKSMAELTKSGHVYVISNIGSFGENVYKIGMTRRLEPMDRVKELGDASVPFNFDVHAMIYSENAPELENALHKEFYNHRLNKINDRREFFKVDLKKVEEVAKKYNADVKFTMEAVAEQYRQTLELENNFKEREKVEQLKKEQVENEKNIILNI